MWFHNKSNDEDIELDMNNNYNTRQKKLFSNVSFYLLKHNIGRIRLHTNWG